MQCVLELARRGIGIILTKLDGAAKGGIAQELNLPVLFAGAGEQMDDLLEFSPAEFVDSRLGSCGLTLYFPN